MLEITNKKMFRDGPLFWRLVFFPFAIRAAWQIQHNRFDADSWLTKLAAWIIGRAYPPTELGEQYLRTLMMAQETYGKLDKIAADLLAEIEKIECPCDKCKAGRRMVEAQNAFHKNGEVTAPRFD